MNTRSHSWRGSVRRIVRLCTGLLVFAMLLVLTLMTNAAQAASAHVDVMVLNTDISPASLHYFTSAIATAEQDGARALIIEIDTPGGDIDSMKSMTQEELVSTIPIISYVGPTGGRAASAGAFVALAAPIVAMAPTTRIGASSPVTSTGADIGSTLKAKIEKDLVAAITGFQHLYGRNEALAASMVTQAASFDDTAAISSHLVDMGAANISALLQAVNGKSIHLYSGRVVTLNTAGVAINTLQPSLLDTLYTFLLDPNVSFLLFVIAIIGIYLEVAHPGTIVPGVTGALALLLFFFSIGSLSPNWTGLALMVLAFVFLVLDVRLPTHGVLTGGAVIALIIGSLLFFNGSNTYGGPQLNVWIVYLMAGVIGAIGFTLVAIILRVQRLHITTGAEGMIGRSAIVLTPLLPEGRVRYAGEDWAAILEPPATSADEGSEVQITAVNGLHLHVRLLHTFIQPHVETYVDTDMLSPQERGNI